MVHDKRNSTLGRNYSVSILQFSGLSPVLNNMFAMKVKKANKSERLVILKISHKNLKNKKNILYTLGLQFNSPNLEVSYVVVILLLEFPARYYNYQSCVVND